MVEFSGNILYNERVPFLSRAWSFKEHLVAGYFNAGGRELRVCSFPPGQVKKTTHFTLLKTQLHALAVGKCRLSWIAHQHQANITVDTLHVTPCTPPTPTSLPVSRR